MATNPYERPGLGAFGEPAARRDALVEDWLRRLRDVTLADSVPATDAHRLDVLTHWARLRRTRPELLARPSTSSDLVRLDALAGEIPTTLVADRWSFDAEQWLREAMRLAASFEDALPVEARRELAERLLTTLDSAELTDYALVKLNPAHPEPSPALHSCRIWLEENPTVFLAATPLVQAIGMSLRPDLADQDYDLALTALKFEVLLDAAEDMQADLTLNGVASLPAETVAKLAGIWRQETWDARDACLPWRYPAGETHAAAATQASESSSVPAEIRIYWRPPADLGLPLEARLAVPAMPLPDDDEVAISFYRLDDGPLDTEQLNPVLFAGAGPATVDTDGCARFRVGELRNRDQPPSLRVSAKHILWDRRA